MGSEGDFLDLSIVKEEYCVEEILPDNGEDFAETVRNCKQPDGLDSVLGDQTFTKCPHCDIYFLDRDRLDKHMLQLHHLHTDFSPNEGVTEVYPVKLEKSEKSEKSKGVAEESYEYLKESQSLKWSERETFKCQYCDFLVHSRQWQIHHTRQFHPGLPIDAIGDGMPIKCLICGKRYKDIEALKRHSEEHRKVPYRCDPCGLKFSLHSQLKAHLHNVHKGLIIDAPMCILMPSLTPLKAQTFKMKSKKQSLARCYSRKSEKFPLNGEEEPLATLSRKKIPARTTTALQSSKIPWPDGDAKKLNIFLKCPNCDVKFKHSSELGEHIVKNHGKRKIFNGTSKATPLSEKAAEKKD